MSHSRSFCSSSFVKTRDHAGVHVICSNANHAAQVGSTYARKNNRTHQICGQWRENSWAPTAILIPRSFPRKRRTNVHTLNVATPLGGPTSDRLSKPSGLERSFYSASLFVLQATLHYELRTALQLAALRLFILTLLALTCALATKSRALFKRTKIVISFSSRTFCLFSQTFIWIIEIYRWFLRQSFFL